MDAERRANRAEIRDRVRKVNEWAAAQRGTITLPAPHVLFGPENVPENVADADYLRDAVRNIRWAEKDGRGLFGSNLTDTVVKLLEDAADALDARGPYPYFLGPKPPANPAQWQQYLDYAREQRRAGVTVQPFVTWFEASHG